jgi:hypothetical protein
MNFPRPFQVQAVAKLILRDVIQFTLQDATGA